MLVLGLQAMLPVKEAMRNLRKEVHVNTEVVLLVLTPLVAHGEVVLQEDGEETCSIWISPGLPGQRPAFDTRNELRCLRVQRASGKSREADLKILQQGEYYALLFFGSHHLFDQIVIVDDELLQLSADQDAHCRIVQDASAPQVVQPDELLFHQRPLPHEEVSGDPLQLLHQVMSHNGLHLQREVWRVNIRLSEACKKIRGT